MTVKVCVKCKIEKPSEDFCKGKNYKNGRRGTCKKCHTNYQIRYYEQNKDKREEKNKMNTRYVYPWKRHHLEEKQYIDLMNKFDGKCHICKKNEATSIDHDHSCCQKGKRSCGKCVRGILCRGCNTALGSLREDPDTIQSLLKYINLA